METKDSRRQERGAGPGPVRTVCDGARQLLLQRTPTEGSYQQSLFRKFLVWSLLILGTVEVFMGDFSKTVNF